VSDPTKPDPEEEGWEGLAEEADGGSLQPSDELEAALREASDAVGSRGGGDSPRGSSGGGGGAHEATIEALANELRSLKDEYERTREELEQTRERHLRLQAEFENFRKRGLKERQEAHHYGHQNLVKDLLPAVDNLERAIAHAEGNAGGDLQGLLQGVELVRRELLAVLAKHGVSEIDTSQGTFDPAFHEAMAQVPDPSVPPNSIVEVLEKGYRLRDRMLRPARVVVSKTPEGGSGGQGGGS